MGELEILHVITTAILSSAATVFGMLTSSMTKETKLAACFESALFIPNLRAADRLQALEEMVDCLYENGRVKDRSLVLEMLRRREILGSTGIGKGIAIPHGRTLAAPELSILFARSADGIDFDALDSKPIHLFFVIVAPPHDRSNIYLPVLGRIVEKVKESRIRQKLMKVASFEELRKVFLADG
ncbi:MAG: PTS sugar transporter subunit IIA [Candidatus Eisenbacteria bacterium]|nr:PTS sugar transporter subunit IIA [Candidatus Eisenbacteria bacterium]